MEMFIDDEQLSMMMMAAMMNSFRVLEAKVQIYRVDLNVQIYLNTVNISEALSEANGHR